MTTTTINYVHESYASESEWIAAAKGLIPAGGKMVTGRGHGSGAAPAGPHISVYDAQGHEVARVTWQKY